MKSGITKAALGLLVLFSGCALDTGEGDSSDSLPACTDTTPAADVAAGACLTVADTDQGRLDAPPEVLSPDITCTLGTYQWRNDSYCCPNGLQAQYEVKCVKLNGIYTWEYQGYVSDRCSGACRR